MGFAIFGRNESISQKTSPFLRKLSCFCQKLRHFWQKQLFYKQKFKFVKQIFVKNMHKNTSFYTNDWLFIGTQFVIGTY